MDGFQTVDTVNYGALLVPFTRAYSHPIDDVSFFPFGEHFLTFGATFFTWRDFFSLARLFFSGATFFLWRDFFFSGATFFLWRDFFFFGATFFSPARLFSLALIYIPLLDLLRAQSSNTCGGAKMADSADNDLL